MKKAIFILWILLLSGIPSLFASEQPDSLVAQGNQAYNDGNFQKAADLFLSVIGQGFESADLYYNLGNAYFKLNDIPSSILYYEKALKLNPKDEDINFNLKLANSRIIDKIEPVPEFFLKKWWKQTVDLMPADKWAHLGITLFFLLLFFVTTFLVSRAVIIRKLSFWTSLILLIFTAFSLFVGYRAHRTQEKETDGIVFTPTVTVKSSPSENSVDLFVVHEGTKVNILLDNLQGWTEIKIANGSVGWIKSSDYKPI